MNFDPTDDRRMLADSMSRYLTDHYGWEHRLKIAYEAPFHDPQKWAEMSELGVLFALADESVGGFGGAGFDIHTVFSELGRALCPEPVLPALMAARLLAAAGEDLALLLSGETRYAVATGELSAPYDLGEIETEASGDRLSGRKSVVYGAHGADTFLVAARNGDTIGLYCVAADAAHLTTYGLIDGGGAAELFLEDTPARCILPDVAAAFADAQDAGALALCAEAVGAMDTCKDMLLDYLKTRKQFGKTIGSFQVLQHRMVDLTIEIEQARSITILAASRMGTPEQSRTASMAKNLIGRVAKQIAEETIQMHGGIAMTWEHPASHFAKRLIMIDHQLGDTDYHLQRVMAVNQAA
ncbi:MAG: acyl-CoA dehydrogenase [Pseudomonadota bacterium]